MNPLHIFQSTTVRHLLCTPQKPIPGNHAAVPFCWSRAKGVHGPARAIALLFDGAPMRVNNWERRHELLCSECQLLAAVAVTNKLTPYLDSEVALKEIARLMGAGK